jgi:dephospho-CoA kinase
MGEIIVVVEDDPEGGYTARALGEAIFTEADSMEELRSMVRDAVRCHFDGDAPAVIRLHYLQEEVMAA